MTLLQIALDAATVAGAQDAGARRTVDTMVAFRSGANAAARRMGPAVMSLAPGERAVPTRRHRHGRPGR